MKTIEGNKLIAEFIGWRKGHPEKDGWKEQWFEKESGIRHKYLLFNTSWDWLMPVVNKCYEIAWRTEMRKDYNIDTFKEIYGELGSENRQNIEESFLGIINITDTWGAVTEFIKWYNER